jgi:hypothetical protein
MVSDRYPAGSLTFVLSPTFPGPLWFQWWMDVFFAGVKTAGANHLPVSRLRNRGAFAIYYPYVHMACFVFNVVSFVDRGFESRQGLGILVFTTMSRQALGPTQPPIQWAPGALSPGVKRPGRQADCSLPSSAEANNAWRYTSTPPIRLNGMVLT